MIHKYQSYICFLILCFCFFIFLTVDVFAISNGNSVRVSLVGTPQVITYRGEGNSQASIFNPPFSTSSFSNMTFYTFQSGDFTSNGQASFRLNWTLPSSNLIDRDSISFVVGTNSGYINVGQIAINGSTWVSCETVSQPPMSSSAINNYSFTAVVCPYDNTLATGDNSTIFATFRLSPYFPSTPTTTSPINFFLSQDVYFFSSSLGDISKDIGSVADSVNDLNDTLNDSSIDSPSSSTDEWSSLNTENGVITSLLSLPIQLVNAYSAGMSSTCQPFNLGSFYGTNLILPCINPSKYLGSALWNIIDVLFSGFMIFAIGKKLVKVFNDFTNLRDTQVDELYGGGA